MFEILKERESGSAGSELTIDDINNVLDELSKVERGSGKNKQGTQAEILDRAYRRMSSLEFKWFVRIILKGESSFQSCPDVCIRIEDFED